MSLQGARQLHARYAAIHKLPQKISESWGKNTAELARGRVKVRTGKTKASIRVERATPTGATVSAAYGAVFLEGGARAHEETAKGRAMRWEPGPLFAKRVAHPATSKQPFLSKSAVDAFDKETPAQTLADLWNEAA